MADQAVNRAEIFELLNKWPMTRDQGRWAECAETFMPNGLMDVSWFHGQHKDFVEASKKGFGSGTFTKHMMVGAMIKSNRNRAYAESSIVLATRQNLHGISTVGTSYFRFLDRLQKVESGWKISHRSAIYDADHILPEFSNEVIAFDMPKLHSLPREYRYLAYGLLNAGFKVPADLPTAGSPAEAAIRANCVAWWASAI